MSIGLQDDFQIPLQCVLPSGQGRKTVLGQFTFIKTGVKGARRFGNTVFRRCDRDYRHMVGIIFRMPHGCGLAEDFHGEIIPADITAFIGGMVITVFFRLNHIYQKAGQVEGVGGRADLVVYYGDVVVGLS